MSEEQRVLLIEDDELWRFNIAGMLEDCGYAVEPVTSWHSAVEQLRASTFYRIVSDLHVVSDAKDGIEMLIRIGALNPPATLVVSKFAGALKPKLLRQLPYIAHVVEKSRITETSTIWRKFLSYQGAEDLSKLILRRRWVDFSSGAGRRIIRIDRKAAFVVHGRDLDKRDNFCTFLRSLNVRVIEWPQAEALTGVATPYIGDVIDAGMAQAQAIIVLLTGDDEAKLRDAFLKQDDSDYERHLTPQARPNVIFEAGYALAKYPTRTILVQIGLTRFFSDIAGRFLLRFDGSSESRRNLVSRLETAEVTVDATGSDWLTSGSF